MTLRPMARFAFEAWQSRCRALSQPPGGGGPGGGGVGGGVGGGGVGGAGGAGGAGVGPPGQGQATLPHCGQER